jgi:pilus assembly protein Flp/PilA
MRRLVNLNKTARIFSNIRKENGNAAIEYGMIAALIAVIIAASLSSVATKLIAVFASVVAAL